MNYSPAIHHERPLSNIHLPKLNLSALEARLYLAACNPLVNHLMGIAGGVAVVVAMRAIPNPAALADNIGQAFSGFQDFFKPDTLPLAGGQDPTVTPFPTATATPSCDFSSPYTIDQDSSVSKQIYPTMDANNIQPDVKPTLVDVICDYNSEELNNNCDLVQPGQKVHLPPDFCDKVQNPAALSTPVPAFDPTNPPAAIPDMAEAAKPNKTGSALAWILGGAVALALGAGIYGSTRKNRKTNP